jgi:hypothetical protein
MCLAGSGLEWSGLAWSGLAGGGLMKKINLKKAYDRELATESL